MRYGSICSGIEAATSAWHSLGWTPAFFSEIEAFPRAVLAHHYPDVPCHGDFTTIEANQYGAIDLLVGGTPCQSFSVAGLRKGLDDERGNLTLEFIRLAERYRPRWLVWENVPGVLSQDRGRAFGSFLGGLAECGYGFAYRVLDAQYFGVPQRRRRVFVIGYLGDWQAPAAVLFERESLRGDTTPRREARKDVAATLEASTGGLSGKEGRGLIPETAPTLSARTKGGGGLGSDFECDGGLIASTGETAHCLNAGGMGRQDYETETLIAHSLRGEGFDASEDGTGRGTPLIPVAFDCKASGRNGFGEGPISPTLRAMGRKDGNDNGGGQVAVMVPEPYTLAIRGRGDDSSFEYRQDGTANALLTPNGGRAGIGVGAIAFDMAQITTPENRSRAEFGLPSPSMAKESRISVAGSSAVRRLTPRECERLQGFPDDYTLIPRGGGRKAADGPRYKALGNSMAVPVMRWIGERIQMVEAIR